MGLFCYTWKIESNKRFFNLVLVIELGLLSKKTHFAKDILRKKIVQEKYFLLTLCWIQRIGRIQLKIWKETIFKKLLGERKVADWLINKLDVRTR